MLPLTRTSTTLADALTTALAQLIIPMTTKPEPKTESIYRKYWRTAK